MTFIIRVESADLGGKNGDLLWVYVLFCSWWCTAVSAINPGNASVPGRPCEHASAAEYLQRDIANSNSNLHSNNIHCIILYYSSIQLIQLWFLTWCVLVAGLLQSAVAKTNGLQRYGFTVDYIHNVVHKISYAWMLCWFTK